MTREELKNSLKELRELKRTIMKHGKAYTIGGQSLTRADLSDIQLEITEIEIKISKMSPRRFGRIIPTVD